MDEDVKEHTEKPKYRVFLPGFPVAKIMSQNNDRIWFSNYRFFIWYHINIAVTWYKYSV